MRKPSHLVTFVVMVLIALAVITITQSMKHFDPQKQTIYIEGR